MKMPPMLPLLVSDPNLPEDLRRDLDGDPRDAARALMQLGLSCHDAVELVGVEPKGTCSW
jgi:hypothetical protein